MPWPTVRLARARLSGATTRLPKQTLERAPPAMAKLAQESELMSPPAPAKSALRPTVAAGHCRSPPVAARLQLSPRPRQDCEDRVDLLQGSNRLSGRHTNALSSSAPRRRCRCKQTPSCGHNAAHLRYALTQHVHGSGGRSVLGAGRIPPRETSTIEGKRVSPRSPPGATETAPPDV